MEPVRISAPAAGVQFHPSELIPLQPSTIVFDFKWHDYSQRPPAAPVGAGAGAGAGTGSRAAPPVYKAPDVNQFWIDRALQWRESKLEFLEAKYNVQNASDNRDLFETSRDLVMHGFRDYIPAPLYGADTKVAGLDAADTGKMLTVPGDFHLDFTNREGYLRVARHGSIFLKSDLALLAGEYPYAPRKKDNAESNANGTSALTRTLFAVILRAFCVLNKRFLMYSPRMSAGFQFKESMPQTPFVLFPRDWTSEYDLFRLIDLDGVHPDIAAELVAYGKGPKQTKRGGKPKGGKAAAQPKKKKKKASDKGDSKTSRKRKREDEEDGESTVAGDSDAESVASSSSRPAKMPKGDLLGVPRTYATGSIRGAAEKLMGIPDDVSDDGETYTLLQRPLLDIDLQAVAPLLSFQDFLALALAVAAAEMQLLKCPFVPKISTVVSNSFHKQHVSDMRACGFWNLDLQIGDDEKNAGLVSSVFTKRAFVRRPQEHPKSKIDKEALDGSSGTGIRVVYQHTQFGAILQPPKAQPAVVAFRDLAPMLYMHNFFSPYRRVLDMQRPFRQDEESDAAAVGRAAAKAQAGHDSDVLVTLGAVREGRTLRQLILANEMSVWVNYTVRARIMGTWAMANHRPALWPRMSAVQARYQAVLVSSGMSHSLVFAPPLSVVAEALAVKDGETARSVFPGFASDVRETSFEHMRLPFLYWTTYVYDANEFSVELARLLMGLPDRMMQDGKDSKSVKPTPKYQKLPSALSSRVTILPVGAPAPSDKLVFGRIAIDISQLETAAPAAEVKRPVKPRTEWHPHHTHLVKSFVDELSSTEGPRGTPVFAGDSDGNSTKYRGAFTRTESLASAWANRPWALWNAFHALSLLFDDESSTICTFIGLQKLTGHLFSQNLPLRTVDVESLINISTQAANAHRKYWAGLHARLSSAFAEFVGLDQSAPKLSEAQDEFVDRLHALVDGTQSTFDGTQALAFRPPTDSFLSSGRPDRPVLFGLYPDNSYKDVFGAIGLTDAATDAQYLFVKASPSWLTDPADIADAKFDSIAKRRSSILEWKLSGQPARLHGDASAGKAAFRQWLVHSLPTKPAGVLVLRSIAQKLSELYSDAARTLADEDATEAKRKEALVLFKRPLAADLSYRSWARFYVFYCRVVHAAAFFMCCVHPVPRIRVVIDGPGAGAATAVPWHKAVDARISTQRAQSSLVVRVTHAFDLMLVDTLKRLTARIDELAGEDADEEAKLGDRELAAFSEDLKPLVQQQQNSTMAQIVRLLLTDIATSGDASSARVASRTKQTVAAALVRIDGAAVDPVVAAVVAQDRGGGGKEAKRA